MIELFHSIHGAWVLGLLTPTFGPAHEGAFQQLIELVPAKSAAAYVYVPREGAAANEPGAKGASASVARLLPTLVDQANRWGLLAGTDAQVRLWIDLTAAFAEVIRFPHALFIQRFDAKEVSNSNGSLRLSDLQMGLVVLLSENGAELERRIQSVLNTHTNTADTRLERGDDSVETYRLCDRRLPDWATIRWMRFGNRYVFTLGDEAWAALDAVSHDRKASAAADPWWAEAVRATNAREASWMLFVDFETSRKDIHETLRTKINDALAPLRLKDVRRGVWTVGYEGRYTIGTYFLEERDGREHRRFADRTYRGRSPERWIPTGASRSAVIDCNTPAIVRGIASAYRASKTPDSRAEWTSFWNMLESESGVNVSKDVLDRLEHCVVIHDHPRNAFGLPLLWTIQIRIDDPNGHARRAVDRFLTTLQSKIPTGSLWRLVADPDGVWYVTFGINGPALTVTPEWLIISFSPRAVRDNVNMLTSLGAERTPQR